MPTFSFRRSRLSRLFAATASLTLFGEACATSVDPIANNSPTATTTSSPSDGGSGGGKACSEACDEKEAPTCQRYTCDGATGQCLLGDAVDGVVCDDGLFCTKGDSCIKGKCEAGTESPCTAAESECVETVCNEGPKTCSATPLPDGGFCTASDQCQVFARCTEGVCVGEPVDCSALPLGPCQVASCDPATGNCKAEAAADGVACQPADLCLGNAKCAGGQCVPNGTPLDCSSLDAPCLIGVCDSVVGGCTQEFALPASACGEGDACTAGTCTAAGVCEMTPVANGTACDHPCSNDATCVSGACTPAVGASCDLDSSLGTSSSQTCVIRGGQLFCWGGAALSPTLLDAGPWLRIASGKNHSCAIKATGELYCWGENQSGQLGVPGAKGATPLLVGSSHDWVGVSGGATATCGIQNSGDLYCWGNTPGIAGDVNGSFVTPTPVFAPTTWGRVSVGDFHACGLRSDASLWCWGDDSLGALGIGTTSEDIQPPTEVGPGYRAVETGFHFSCGIKTDDSLYCWGQGDYGQLGDGTATDTTVPVQVAVGTTWKRVALGGAFACGIKNDGTLWCWGQNVWGQLGNGSDQKQIVPIHVGNSNQWLEIATGDSSACGLRSDSSVWCWGQNTNGQLGDGTKVSKKNPTKVTF